jgi:hypothetical protein
MDPIKRTTILFPPGLYDQLARLAKQRHSSVGELVREACQSQYFFSDSKERTVAVDRLPALNLPVGAPRQMKRESVPDPKPLC